MRNLKKYLMLSLALFVVSVSISAQNNSYAAAVEDVDNTAVVQVDTIIVKSKTMNREIKNVVILPEQYFENNMQDMQYPVVYMLNGYGGNHSDYITRIEGLEEMATDFGFILICPDGQDSWYFDSPIDKSYQFETYITKELVTYIDDNYRTYPTAKMRAIMGLSMGGHGALWLAMRHSDIFSIAGSMSGGVDFTKFPTKWKISQRLGDYETNKSVWESHTVMSLVPTLKNKQIKMIFDVGVDDFFYGVNVALHNALLEKGIEHDFITRPGKHTWQYWDNSIDYQFLFFQKGFEANDATTK